MELNYVEAFNLARKLRLENDGVGCVFQNIIRVSMYDDKGDTTSLKVAAKNLETCKTEGLWDALRNFEIGYVLTETGHSVKGAMQTRSAANQFEDAKDYESKAFYAIYAYYLAERGLKKAPNHPVMLQIKADMLYRLERYGEAAAIYEKSAADYLERTGKSIRYWCSVLNLIRIYHDAGDDTKSQEQREKLNDPDYQKLKKWMPGSLIDDLTDRKLI